MVDVCDKFLAEQAEENELLSEYTPNKETLDGALDCLDWSELAGRCSMPRLSEACANYIKEKAEVHVLTNQGEHLAIAGKKRAQT